MITYLLPRLTEDEYQLLITSLAHRATTSEKPEPELCDLYNKIEFRTIESNTYIKSKGC